MIFKQSDFLSGMDHTFVKDLMDGAEKTAHAAGDILFREGDATRAFFVLIKGHVKLTVGKDAQTVYVINHPGECFGWSSLVNRACYSASAVCAAPTTLMRIDKTASRAVMEKNPAQGLLFMERVAGMIGDRLLQSYRALSSFALLADHPTDGTGQVQESRELV